MIDFAFIEIIKKLDIKKGDILLVSSNVSKLLWYLYKKENTKDLNLIINYLQDIVSSSGTLLFPTFNWDFCNGIAFNYFKTPSKTGALSTLALKRSDFKRTKHPIYSFAVWGKHQDYLYGLDNKESFGPDSPFGFLYKEHGKNLLIDIDYQKSLTFTHFVEESIGVIYRFKKLFLASYIDEKSNCTEKEFSMYVRNLDLNTENNINPIGDILQKKGFAKKTTVNDISFIVVDLFYAFEIIKNDIVFNNSRNLVIYDGQ